MNLANQNALYHQAPKESIGMSAGLLRTFMYIGAIVSSTANGIFFKGGDITVGIHNDGIFCASLVLMLIDNNKFRFFSSELCDKIIHYYKFLLKYVI